MDAHSQVDSSYAELGIAEDAIMGSLNFACEFTAAGYLTSAFRSSSAGVQPCARR
jgi:hypothetical protein